MTRSQQYASKGRTEYAATILNDLNKFFDTIDHHMLPNKVLNYGIDDPEHIGLAHSLRVAARSVGVSSYDEP